MHAKAKARATLNPSEVRPERSNGPAVSPAAGHQRRYRPVFRAQQAEKCQCRLRLKCPWSSGLRDPDDPVGGGVDIYNNIICIFISWTLGLGSCHKKSLQFRKRDPYENHTETIQQPYLRSHCFRGPRSWMQGTAPTSAGRGFQKWDDFGVFFTLKYQEDIGSYRNLTWFIWFLTWFNWWFKCFFF